MLKWDPYTGDYGPNFFGHAFNIATYVIKHPEFGWQSFGGNVRVSGDWVYVQPLDSFRKRVYIAPLGLWLTLDAGTFERIAINTRSNVVRVTLSASGPFTPNARLRVQQPAKIERVGTYAPRQKFVNERDAFTIPLGRSTIMIELLQLNEEPPPKSAQNTFVCRPQILPSIVLFGFQNDLGRAMASTERRVGHSRCTSTGSSVEWQHCK